MVNSIKREILVPFLVLGRKGNYRRSEIFHSYSDCVSIAVVPAVRIDGDPKQFQAIGHDMQLTCRCNASPPASGVLWKKDGTVIARNTTVQIDDPRITILHYNESQIQLTVINTTSQDAGNYTCVVTNGVGNSSDTTIIVIEGVFYIQNQLLNVFMP